MLFVPLEENKKGEKILAFKRFFPAKDSFSKLQDSYGVAMASVGLKRGLKGSRASHISIAKYYALLNKKLNIEDIEQFTAMAADRELLQKNILELQYTLEAYKRYMNQTEIEKQKAIKDNINLVKQLKAMKKQGKVYENTITAMAKAHNISPGTIKQILYYAEKQLNADNSKGSELEK